jgi:hypothetical protein
VLWPFIRFFLDLLAGVAGMQPQELVAILAELMGG